MEQKKHLGKRRERVLALAAIGVTLLILFVVLEVAFRIYYFHHDEKIRNGMKLLWSPLYSSIAAPHSHGPQVTPEYSISLRSNGEGFRDPDHPPGEPPPDVALIGDSYTWGSGAEEPQRFGNILARQTGLSVFNYGLCTAGTINELAIYRDFVAKRHPKLVMLFFFPNDVQNDEWWLGDMGGAKNAGNLQSLYKEMKRRKTLPDSWPDQVNIAVPHWYSSAFLHFVRVQIARIRLELRTPPTGTLKLKDGEKVKVEQDILDANSNWSPALRTYTPNIRAAWRLTETAMKAFLDSVKHNGSKFILVYIPYQERIEPHQWQIRKKAFRLTAPDKAFDFDRPRRHLEAWAREHGVEFLDLTPALAKAWQHNSKQNLYYNIDGHLTPRGNRVVAAALDARLKADGYAP